MQQNYDPRNAAMSGSSRSYFPPGFRPAEGPGSVAGGGGGGSGGAANVTIHVHKRDRLGNDGYGNGGEGVPR